MKRYAVATALVAVLTLPATASAQSRFGELFPDLPPLNTQSNQQLADLAQTQLDPNLDDENNCAQPLAVPPVDCVGSGFTYLGQFLDHDLTLDTSPSPLAPVDFTQFLNNRTLAFDLDSVYGAGPVGSPQLYEADGVHLRVQDPNLNGVVDLPRNANGSAILGDGRNDENQVIAQLHVVFLKAHNAFVDQGMTFAQARRALTLHYQQVVLDDFVPHTLGMPLASASGQLNRNMVAAGRLATGMTPVEFSVAAYRFGHSQVRRAYELNEGTGKIQVFSFTQPDLRGGVQIQMGRQIDWGEFFPELEDEDDPNGGNISRKIDPLISSSLFQLPIPGAEAQGSNVLAFRNMIRAKFYDMPSGQSVAQALHIKPLTNAEIGLPASVAPAFANGVPLWYYVLAEAKVRENGRRLGHVGSILVGSTFASALMRDPNSVVRGNRQFKPDPEIAGDDKRMQMSDLIRFAGLVPDEEEE